jgi:DmsE family decaheme c-type cytochrome
MDIGKPSLAALLLLSGLFSSAAAVAQEAQYSPKGADTCLMCHTEAWPYPIFPIFKTKHANRADKRTPFAGLQCEACHGPGARHAATADKNAILSFKQTSSSALKQYNQVCLGCHQNNTRIDWVGSMHDSNDIACTSCHRLHAEHDPVRDRVAQSDVCYQCHRRQRADFNKPSVHPVRFGLMACSDCHSSHGSNTAAMLVKPTVNQTCYTCHAEKRGPFLWEHAPAAEQCTLCHDPHGSALTALLTKIPPLLCQQCHTAAEHPSVAYNPSGLPGGGGSGGTFVLAGSCTNCHSQVHGSNHPAGVKLMR